MKTIFTILMMLFIVLGSAQTTTEEYNYLTKGYKIQLESGLDMKKGYTIEKKWVFSDNYITFERKSTFYYLYRDSEKAPCATLMIVERSDTRFQTYLCIPHIDSEESIWKQARTDFNNATNDWKEAPRAYMFQTMKMVSFVSSKSVKD